MKIGPYILFWCALLLPFFGWATTLQLSTDIDLLVLDGKKVSSSLLKGADSIELDNGAHQIVFRVEKNVRANAREQRLYISAPLVVSFDTKQISQVNFNLPRIENEKECEVFDNTPHLQLLDGSAVVIPIRLDVLTTTSTPQGSDYENDTQRYNKAGKIASMPQFAIMMADDSALLSRTSELDPPVRPSETLTEQRLKYWFAQADKATRERFLRWVKEHPSS
ncbi:curli synthesis inhibitor [Dryocola sp. BD613]|uniref:curli synthesis inhibitor n=1 Tax=Dryocola sp. BD613 TaxID=3133272 RepID=UPI003F5063B8